jgi:hypothetical protein
MERFKMKLVNGTVEYNLVKSPIKGNRLPKRAGRVEIVVDGAPFVAPVTSNRAWSASPEFVLEYVWVEKDGVAYYATLDYAVAADSWKGAEVTIADGVAKRADPKRVTAAVERETTRVDKFKKWAAARV